MALRDWDEIVQEYKDLYLNSRYSYHAKAMIELIPSIRSLTELDGITPGTSHGALLFRVDVKAEIITVLYSEDGVYTVYLGHPSDGKKNKLLATATSEDIVPLLKDAIKRLKSIKDSI